MSLESNRCRCNDITLAKDISCFRCQKKWIVKLEHHERVSRCPKHHMSIAMCGGATPPLCEKCDEGYFVDRQNMGMFPTWVLVKKE